MSAPAPPAARLLRTVVALESTVERGLAGALRRRGWRPQVVAFPGYGAAPGGGGGADAYGSDGWVRVLARVLLLPARRRTGDWEGGRGWRRFLTIAVPDAEVSVRAGTRDHTLATALGGYLDAVVAADLPAGWHTVWLQVGDEPPMAAPTRVVGADERLGVVSDIDDTVMITALPRPLLAAWNTFVRHEMARRPVPGMAELLRRLSSAGPQAVVVYLSTGAWNVAPTLVRFLERHGYPPGPLLLTDWGPTAEHWFRSGREHKRSTLRRLLRELPGLSWVLVGDDGQHDPQIYDELVAEAPESVRLVAIRQLSPAEQVLTHGSPVPPDDVARAGEPVTASAGVPWLQAHDGHGLARLLGPDPVPHRVGSSS